MKLTGINAANPQAYMAALGALRTITREYPQARMHWDGETPVLTGTDGAGEGDITSVVDSGLRLDIHDRVLGLGNDIALQPEHFVEIMNGTDQELVEWVGAFGTLPAAKKGHITPTPFRFLAGAGGSQFVLKTVGQIQAGLTQEKIRRTLFAEWDYADKKMTLRWDPNDYRPYALDAKNPSDVDIPVMHGGIRLAFEALPYFQVLAPGRTVGWDGNFLVCPTWSRPRTVAEIAGLLNHKSIYSGRPEKDVFQVFRAERFRPGKQVNFRTGVRTL